MADPAPVVHNSFVMTYEFFIVLAERLFQAGGVLAMIIGAGIGAAGFARDRDYERLRLKIARGILLGLELLVAADIIATVSTEPELSNVAALAVIVIIRTFLSYSLQMETIGRWPWQSDRPR